MSDEDKMRSEFEKQHAIHFELTRHGDGYFYSNEQDSWDKFKECWEAATKACAAIKDAEIAELNNRLRIEENAHAELQSRCFDQGGTFSNVFDELKQCKAEIAARDLMIKELRERIIGTSDYLEACGQSDSVEIDLNNEVLAKSEHHDSRALEKMLLEAELFGFETNNACVRYERIIYLKYKLAELNKE